MSHLKLQNLPKIVQELDLEPIIVKAMDKESGYGWSLEYALTMEKEYKRYLTLCLEYPDYSVVTSKQVDEFWHLHILDTLKYQEDCFRIFGYFLHHFPYFGMRDQQDETNLISAWKKVANFIRNDLVI